MTFLRNLLSLTPQEQIASTVPFSRLASEKERKLVIDKEDLRVAYFTNPLIFRAINIRASLTVARGYVIRYENDSIKNVIEQFLKDIRKNDPRGLNFNQIIKQMCIDTDVFGNAFSKLVLNKTNKSYVGLVPLHPVNTDFLRDSVGKVEVEEGSRMPKGYEFRDDQGQKITLERDEIAHLAFNVVGDEIAGYPLLGVVFNQLERLGNIEEGLAQAIYKKGWPLHEAVLHSREGWIPKETDVALVSKDLDEIDSASHFTHTDDYELKVHDPKFPPSAINYPDYFVNQVVSVTGVPKYILLGDESANTRATAEALQRIMGPILAPQQELIASMVETKIFKKVLEKADIKGWCRIEWNEVLAEKDDRIAEKVNILGATLVEGRPVVTWEEAREMIGLPADLPEAKTRQNFSAIPKTVGGIYLTPPHGQLIAMGRKKGIVKSVAFTENLGVPLALVSGNYIWGKIQLDSPVPIGNKEFHDLYWKHQITDEEREEWWPGKKQLFFYPLQLIEIFQTPKFYKAEQGVQTFIRGLNI